jgi:D-inositol-3-phosphate glycosyltransferase
MNFVRLALWLKEKGRQIIFLAREGSPCFREAEKVGLGPEKVSKPAKYFAITSGRALSKRFARSGSDLVFFSFGIDNDVIAWAKATSPASLKVIYIQQMQLGISKRNFYQSWRFLKIDRWVAPLTWLKNEVLELTTYPAEKIREIPLGQDLENFATFEESQADSRIRLGLPALPILIGSMGRLDPAKGFDFLIECFARLGPEFREVELLVMGENTKGLKSDYGDFLKKLANDLGIGSRVHFLPFSQKPERFFNAIDIFLMAARKETFGMVTVEAMASKKPVIAPDSGGSTELLDAGGVGILYKERDSHEFILKLSKLLGDEALRNRLAIIGRERSLTLYSRKVVTNKILNLIDGDEDQL